MPEEEPVPRAIPAMAAPGPGEAVLGMDMAAGGAQMLEDDLLPAAIETASRIAENAPLSVRQAKKSIHYGLQMDVRTAFRFEIEAYNRLVGTEDRHEGIASFNEKRRPVFKGK